MSELDDILKDHQPGPSDFQMDYMITAQENHEHPYAQYKQAVRELADRQKGLRMAYLHLETLRLDLADAQNNDNPRSQIEAAKFAFLVEEQEAMIARTEAEFLRFFAQAKALRVELGGNLTEERRAELDREMWLNRRPDIRKKLKEKEPFKDLKVDKSQDVKELIKASKKKTD